MLERLEFCVLSSGSRANCLYVGSAGTRVLIDCGLSCRRAAERLSSIGIDPDTIQAILVTHEHDDHVSGIRVFSKRHGARVFATTETLAHSEKLQEIPRTSIACFSSGRRFTIGDISFEPFQVVHDAADPVGFRITAGGKTLAVATDLGQVTTLVRERLRCADALILESNHDLEMLQQAPYPWPVKQRIGSRLGHLSNCAAEAFVEELGASDPGRLQVLVAAHISEKTNLPELALGGFERAWRKLDAPREPAFEAASAHTPGKRYEIL